MKLGPFIAFGGAVGGGMYRYCTVRYSMESELDLYFTCIVRE